MDKKKQKGGKSHEQEAKPTPKPKRSDIDRIQIIHDVKREFSIPDDVERDLRRQLSSPQVAEAAERFFRGYRHEDLFELVFAELPWVKLIHPLSQSQMPECSKKQYQVPDFTVLFEASALPHRPVLIETKTVKGTRQTVELMRKQVDAIEAYAAALDVPVLFAVYWEGFSSWTVVSSDQFSAKKNKLVLKLGDAAQADLSIIFGDLTFVIPPVHRRLVCDTANHDSTRPQHEDGGTIIEDNISFDGENWFTLTPIESCIMDSLVQMTVINDTQKEAKRLLEERSTSFYMPKFSHWTMLTLARFGTAITDQHVRFVMAMIADLMAKANCMRSHMVPSRQTAKTGHLFHEAFDGTDLWRHYEKVENAPSGQEKKPPSRADCEARV